MSAGPEEIALAVVRLRAGGVVAFPTETVYGLGADALNPTAIDRVFALKGRPAHNPLIVHVRDETMARTVVDQWPDAAARLAAVFWPGPLTIVLPRAPQLPAAITAGGPTVGIRCPGHHVTLALLTALGRPLVGPSANPSGGVSPTTAEHVRASFTPEEVYVLDGGPCRGGIESTVLSLAGSQPRILRPGLISAEEIEIVLGQAVADPKQSPPSPGARLESPGQLAVHYAPRSPAVLFDPHEWPSLAAAARGPIMVLGRTMTAIENPHALIRMPAEAGPYAARLYAALREADAALPSLIAIERPPATGPIWDAIADRLARATARPA